MQVSLRPASEEDFEFAFKVKREALGPHVVARWDWDEEFQLALHRRRWTERPWSVLQSKDESIGTVSILQLADHVRFGEFYLLPQFQRKGIGTDLLKRVIAQSDEAGIPIRLEYLKWSPVGTLYGRHGFSVISENETHYFMERVPYARGGPGAC